MDDVLTALAYAVAPTLAIPAGAALIAWRPPSHLVRSILMHFAAGGLIAVIAVELLGEFEEVNPLAVAIGVLLGTGFMAGLETITGRLERAGHGEGLGFLAVVTVDFFVDGLLLGVALEHDSSFGLVLAAVLTLEDLVTGLSVASALVATHARRRVLAVVALVALAFPLGAAVGALVGGIVTGSAYVVLLAFAAVALLFLALEELLREAHQVHETPLITSTLFLGLLAFLLLERAVGGH